MCSIKEMHIIADDNKVLQNKSLFGFCLAFQVPCSLVQYAKSLLMAHHGGDDPYCFFPLSSEQEKLASQQQI